MREKFAFIINEELANHLVVGQRFEFTRIEHIDGVDFAIFREAAEQSVVRTNDPLMCTCFQWEDEEECPVHGI